MTMALLINLPCMQDAGGKIPAKFYWLVHAKPLLLSPVSYVWAMIDTAAARSQGWQALTCFMKPASADAAADELQCWLWV